MTRNDAGSTGDEGAQPRRQRKTTQRAHATPPDDTFAAYMRDVSRHPLLTPEEERDLALGIAELRVGYWREVLSYAPYAEAATMLLEDIMEMTPALRGALEEVRSRANAARRSNKKTVRDAYATAADGAARALALADAECIGADRIAADLEQLSTGFARGVSMSVCVPRKGSRPFAEHLQRVRRSSAALRTARNRFARANLRLVIRIAGRFHRSSLSLHDRVQEGNLGLLKAIDRFDATRGFRFSTYATWWIKHSIRRAAMNRGRTIRLPAHLQSLANKIRRASADLRVQLRRDPTHEEVAAMLGVEADKIEMVRTVMAQRPISLDAPISDADGRVVADLLSDEDEVAPPDRLFLERSTERMRGTLLRLDPMARDILRQRFGLDGVQPRTLSEIGEQYALSRERIRQLQQKAIARMRAHLPPPA